MRPLDRLPSIRAKLGSVIVFAVAVTILIMYLTVGFALRKKEQGQQFLILQEQTQTVVAAGFSDSGNPTAALDPRARQVPAAGRWSSTARGTSSSQQFPVPPTVARVLHGQTDSGTHRPATSTTATPSTATVTGSSPPCTWRARSSVAVPRAPSAAPLSLLKSVWWQLLLAGADLGGDRARAWRGCWHGA